MLKLPKEISVLGVTASLPELFDTLGSDSLVEYTSVTRVEPITLIESSLQAQPYINDIMQTLSSLFSGYYLQAIQLSNSLGDINIASRLDKFNPNREANRTLASKLNGMVSAESHSLKVPKYSASNESAYHVGHRLISTEAGSGGNKGNLESLKSMDNIAVGKMVEVTITDGDKAITIPVTIRLVPMAVRSKALVQAFAPNAYQNTAKERYYRWRAGELSLIGDLILCNDLVDAHRKNLMNDKSGFYKQMSDARSKNKLAAMVTGSPSVATASTMAVITTDTKLAMERELNGKIDNFKFRSETIFADSSLMILMVVEEEWERVKIYHRGVSTVSDLSFRDLKSANKGSGPDVAEIMKAYQMTSAPAI